MAKSNGTGSAGRQEHGKRVTEIVQALVRAGNQGALSPNGALSWARSIAAGETHPALLDQLEAGPAEIAAKTRADFAAASGEIISQVVSILDSMQSEPHPDEWGSLFPPSTLTGRPEPGYLSEQPGEITDREADRLWPPVTASDVEARHRQREAEAGKILDYDDGELHSLLFGDSSFSPEGGPENG